MSWGGIKRNVTDALFSDYVRILAKWNCQKCRRNFSKRRQQLHNSHYYGRRAKSVRWSTENCTALCSGCHRYFEENPGEYTRFMKNRLGEERYWKLTVRAKTPINKLTFSEEAIRVWLKNELKKI